MTQGFSQQGFSSQQVKTRMAVLIFLKSMAAPMVLYVNNPNELYDEILSYLKVPTTVKLIEKETTGPIKKVAFMSNQISGVAIQEEQYVQ